MKVEEVEELYSLESLREDIYKFWGYRFDFKESEAKKPKKVYERLLTEIPQSLTEQRERLLDSGRRHPRRDRRRDVPVEQAAGGLGLEGDPRRVRRALRREAGGLREHRTTPRSSRAALYLQAEKAVEDKEKELGTELLLRIFRHFYLEEIDRAWVEHLTNMEHLRDGIGLRGYGQKDPKQEYKKEGYDIFITMMAATSSNVATKIFKVKVRKETEIERIEREDAERTSSSSARCRCATARRSTAARTQPSGAAGAAAGRSRARSRRRQPCGAKGRRSGATTRAPAGAARSSRSATARPSKKRGLATRTTRARNSYGGARGGAARERGDVEGVCPRARRTGAYRAPLGGLVS